MSLTQEFRQTRRIPKVTDYLCDCDRANCSARNRQFRSQRLSWRSLFQSRTPVLTGGTRVDSLSSSRSGYCRKVFPKQSATRSADLVGLATVVGMLITLLGQALFTTDAPILLFVMGFVATWLLCAVLIRPGGRRARRRE